MKLSLPLLFLALLSFALPAQDPWQPPEPTPKQQNRFGSVDPFAQLGPLLPTPSDRRTASGAPGPEYWQQKVDYEIDVRIDERTRMLSGKERITYHNRSPHELRYLWLQLEPNKRTPHSDANLTQTAPDLEKPLEVRNLQRLLAARDFDGGVRIEYVRQESGASLPHTIVKTMMRIDLSEPLAPGKSIRFELAWNYLINRSDEVRGRSMAEWFEKDGNWLFELAQWFPRMCAYDDTEGWQNKQFLGRGEFALEFGDYTVRITVPSDHIVASTGELQNPETGPDSATSDSAWRSPWPATSPSSS